MMDIYNSKIPLIFGPHPWAITIGQRTWYSVPESEVDESWRKHEDCHKAQWKREGAARFAALYFWDYLRGRAKGLNHMDAYLAIRYEVEARNHGN